MSDFFANPYLAALSISGVDSAAFLQGQLSTNTDAMQPAQWRRTAYCSPKGRMIASMLIIRHSTEEYIALLSAAGADDVTSRLSRFILRAKVSIRRLSAVESCRTNEDSPAPKTHYRGECYTQNGHIVLTESDSWQLRLCLNGDDATATTDNPEAATDWRRGQILRGVPWIDAAAADKFIPQYVNWDLLDGIDFDKGCYVGQEIIARLHYLGNVKRRAYVARAAAENHAALPAAGDKTEDGRGEIVNAALGGGELALLISAARDIGKTAHWQGLELSITEPPYALPSAADDHKPRPKI